MKNSLRSRHKATVSFNLNSKKWCQATDAEILQDFEAIGQMKEHLKSSSRKMVTSKMIRKQVIFTQRKYSFRKPSSNHNELDACLGFATFISELQNHESQSCNSQSKEAPPPRKKQAYSVNTAAEGKKEAPKKTLVQKAVPIKRACIHIFIAYSIHDFKKEKERRDVLKWRQAKTHCNLN